MIFSRLIPITLAAAVAIAAAMQSGCVGNSAGIAPPPTDTVCAKGALVPGDSIAGLFDSQNGCRIVDLFTGETTFANGYSLALTSGKGYLITMGTTDSNIYLRPSLELTNTKKQLIGYDSYYWPWLAALAFVADSTVTWQLRAATADTLAGDLGYYFVKMQSCRVPGILSATTDSITRHDSLTTNDCLIPLSDFYVNDSSRLNLYSISMTAGMARTLRWQSALPLIVLIGPTPDTFGTLKGATGADSTGSFSGSLEFAPGVTGDFTIMIGSYGYTTSTLPYTLTIGQSHIQTDRVATQSSRSLFRQPVVQHRPTPLSAGRPSR